jgi:hypothetical protein
MGHQFVMSLTDLKSQVGRLLLPSRKLNIKTHIKSDQCTVMFRKLNAAGNFILLYCAAKKMK